MNTPAGKTCASSTHTVPTHEQTAHTTCIHLCNLCIYCQNQTHGRLDFSCVVILDCSGGTNAKWKSFPLCELEINWERCRFSVGKKDQGMHCVVPSEDMPCTLAHYFPRETLAASHCGSCNGQCTTSDIRQS